MRLFTSIFTVSVCVILFTSCKKDKRNSSNSIESNTAIKSFVFNDIIPPVEASVDTGAKSIKIILPPGTDPTGLTPTIELYNNTSTISPASLVPNNFMVSQTYTVTSTSGTTAQYTTLLLHPAPSIKDIPAPPKQLCIYYGWPSLVNGSNGNLTSAINIFKEYDLIVFGDGIWNLTHGDHANTQSIITQLKALKPGIKIFGYIDVSKTVQNLSEQQLKDAIDGWQQIGADGVFGDEFDSDYGVNRSRQNFFIDYAHGKGLSVFANGFIIEDVLSGADCHLSGAYDDYYLMESYFIMDGSYTDMSLNIYKSTRAYYYMKNKGVGIACVARDLPANVTASTNQSDKFKQSWYATAMYNFDAFQYTNKNFCSQGEFLYNFPNPITSYGTSWLDFNWVHKVNDSLYQRSTNTTTLYISGNGTSTGSGGY